MVSPHETDRAPDEVQSIRNRYARIRGMTEALARPLDPEDAALQSMPEASPTKWHLGHTSWFFEAFVLARLSDRFAPYDARLFPLFNSYYESMGPKHPRDRRGLLSRPSLAEVLAYRHFVDERMEELFAWLEATRDRQPFLDLVRLGLEHEHQHQELLLTDILHLFSLNPLEPAYRSAEHPPTSERRAPALRWHSHPEGEFEVGHRDDDFAYDNERPAHRVFLQAFDIASRLVTNGEYLAFVEDGGYERPELWLADGFTLASSRSWRAPLYWRERNGQWMSFGLHGLQPLDLEAPVTHLSFYEADAFARWYGARLPTEQEWERAASELPIAGNFLESGRLSPSVATETTKPSQLFGDAWEWTQSPYVPYPGFRPLPGSLGEYNGKFMCNQMVLRGGSCLTPEGHVRPSYRNYFPPSARWQMTGIRLARSS